MKQESSVRIQTVRQAGIGGGETNNGLREVFIMKHRGVTHIILSAAIFVLALFALAGCGGGKPGVKDYAGYYTLNRRRQDKPNLAISISSKGEVVYMREYMSGIQKGECTQTGTLHVNKDGEAEIIFTEEYHRGEIVEASYANYCPLYLEISEDGKTALLSSDSADWTTDVYQVVDKETFARFVEEECEKMITWDGSQYLTYDERHPEVVAQREAEQAQREAEQEGENLASFIAEIYFEYQLVGEESEEAAEAYLQSAETWGPEGQIFVSHIEEIDAGLSGMEDFEEMAEWVKNGPLEQYLEEYRSLQ